MRATPPPPVRVARTPAPPAPRVGRRLNPPDVAAPLDGEVCDVSKCSRPARARVRFYEGSRWWPYCITEHGWRHAKGGYR